MPKSPSGPLRNRLSNLFSGLAATTPRTGRLPAMPGEPEATGGIGGWLWETDTDGNYRWVSPEVEREIGIRPRELIGRPVDSIGITPESSGMLHRALAQGGPVRNLSLDGRDGQGRRLTLVVNALPRGEAVEGRWAYRGVFLVIGLVEEMPPPAPQVTPAPQPSTPPAPKTVPETDRLAVPIAQPPEELGPFATPPLAPTWGEATAFVDDGQAVKAIDEVSETPFDEEDHKLVVPIRLQDLDLGELVFDTRQDGQPWTDEDRALAEAVSQQLAVALQDARSNQLTQNALAEMREADRLKTQFLANMSHELRTPLNSIIGFSRVILKGIDGPITSQQEEDLKAIYNAGQHLLGLINDVLDLSKIEAGKVELAFSEVDLNDVLRGVMSTAEGLVQGKEIALVTDIPDDLPMITADSIRVRQILLNLVSNAVKFTERGQIGVSARKIDSGARPEILVAVFDTGPGIALEDQRKLFEPFSQVDASPTRKTGGTGLGLSICRHLVELHGGRIWVESTPGQGSTFAFTLPIEPPDLTGDTLASDSAATRAS
jgi:signal transduction histidine kinase